MEVKRNARKPQLAAADDSFDDRDAAEVLCGSDSLPIAAKMLGDCLAPFIPSVL